MKKDMKRYYQEHKEELKAKSSLLTNGLGERKSVIMKQNIQRESNFTCQRCGKVAYNQQLHTHHVIPTSILGKRLDEPDNLICLCNTCHQRIHYLIKGITSIEVINTITEQFLNRELLSPGDKRDNYNGVVAGYRPFIRGVQEEIRELIAKKKRISKAIKEVDADRKNQKYIEHWRTLGAKLHDYRLEYEEAKTDLQEMKETLKDLRCQKADDCKLWRTW